MHTYNIAAKFQRQHPCFWDWGIHHHHMRLTPVTPNTHGTKGIHASAGRTPSYIPPSTTVLCYFLFYIHSLHVSLDTTLHVFLRAPLPTAPVTFILVHLFTQSFSFFSSMSPNHLNHALWILASTHSMPKWLNISSLRFLSFNDTPHAHPSYHHLFSPPQPIQVPRIRSPRLVTIYQHSEHRHHIFFYSVSNRHPFLSKLVLAH